MSNNEGKISFTSEFRIQNELPIVSINYNYYLSRVTTIVRIVCQARHSFVRYVIEVLQKQMSDWTSALLVRRVRNNQSCKVFRYVIFGIIFSSILRFIRIYFFLDF